MEQTYQNFQNDIIQRSKLSFIRITNVKHILQTCYKMHMYPLEAIRGCVLARRVDLGIVRATMMHAIVDETDTSSQTADVCLSVPSYFYPARWLQHDVDQTRAYLVQNHKLKVRCGSQQKQIIHPTDCVSKAIESFETTTRGTRRPCPPPPRTLDFLNTLKKSIIQLKLLFHYFYDKYYVFVMSTKYICKKIRKPLRHIFAVHIYHVTLCHRSVRSLDQKLWFPH